jgi:hypothetical protein
LSRLAQWFAWGDVVLLACAALFVLDLTGVWPEPYRSRAHSMGFLGQAASFLAAHPELDWAITVCIGLMAIYLLLGMADAISAHRAISGRLGKLSPKAIVGLLRLDVLRVRPFSNGGILHALVIGLVVTSLSCNSYHLLREVGARAVVAWLLFAILFATYLPVVATVRPALLLLSASDVPQSRALELALAKAIRPFRVVTLRHLTFDERRSVRARSTDNFRMRQGIIWHERIVPVMQMTPLIVMDMRHPTDALRTELGLVRTYRLAGRTWIVVREKDARLSRSLAEAGMAEAKVVTERELLSEFRRRAPFESSTPGG